MNEPQNEWAVSLDLAKEALELIGYSNAQYIGDIPPDNIPACDSFDVYYFVLFLNGNDYYIALSKEYEGMYWEFQSENGGYWSMSAGGFAPNGYLLYNFKISQDHKVISGGKKYILFNNWTHGWTKELSASGYSLLPQDVAHILPDVPYSSDFRIEFASPPNNNNVEYELYDANFERIYWQTFFTPPSQPGVYYLVFSAAWTDSEGNGSMYQFFVKLDNKISDKSPATGNNSVYSSIIALIASSILISILKEKNKYVY